MVVDTPLETNTWLSLAAGMIKVGKVLYLSLISIPLRLNHSDASKYCEVLSRAGLLSFFACVHLRHDDSLLTCLPRHVPFQLCGGGSPVRGREQRKENNKTSSETGKTHQAVNGLG